MVCWQKRIGMHWQWRCVHAATDGPTLWPAGARARFLQPSQLEGFICLEILVLLLDGSDVFSAPEV